MMPVLTPRAALNACWRVGMPEAFVLSCAHVFSYCLLREQQYTAPAMMMPIPARTPRVPPMHCSSDFAVAVAAFGVLQLVPLRPPQLLPFSPVIRSSQIWSSTHTTRLRIVVELCLMAITASTLFAVSFVFACQPRFALRSDNLHKFHHHGWWGPEY